MATRKKKQSGLRRPRRRKATGRWRRVLQIFLAALGVWLLYEAWRFPRVAPLASARPTTTALMAYREAQAGKAGLAWEPRYQWCAMPRISPWLRRAVVVAEDARFYQHRGFDRIEINDALRDHFVEGKRLRGASTISQQLARTLWLSPSRDPLRKLREAVYTMALERELNKDRILELYLNVVEWGPAVFGAEAASRHYFGLAPWELSPRQAALLAAALPSPIERDPGHPSRSLTRRADLILERMGVDERKSRPARPASTATREPEVRRPTPAPTTPPQARSTPKPRRSEGPVTPAVRETPAATPVDLLAPPGG